MAASSARSVMRSVCAIGVGVATLALLVSVSAAGAGGSETCARQWRHLSLGAANRFTRVSDSFFELAASGPNDVWAVGRRKSSRRYHPVFGHWNGKHWHEVALAAGGEFLDVAVRGRRDVWALATNRRVMHWDGSRLHIEPTPGPTGWGSNLVVTGDGTLWLDAGDGLYARRGSQWARLASGDPGRLVLGPKGQLWTLGSSLDMLKRWTGDGWADSPMPKIKKPLFESIALTSGGDAFVFGAENGLDENLERPLILRRTQDRWVRFPTPAPARPASIEGLAGSSSDHLWATVSPWGSPKDSYLVEWNGTTWQEVPRPPTPLPGASYAGPELLLAGEDLWLAHHAVTRLSCDG